MAILHLQLEVDSDVQPELYAVLATIGLSLPRAERLRQLAAAGLIWEHLRLQALAGLAGTPHLPELRAAEPVRLNLHEPSAPTPRPPPVPEPAASSLPPAPAPLPGEDFTLELPVLDDVVEDVDPALVAGGPRRTAPSRRNAPAKAPPPRRPEPQVLVDVLEDEARPPEPAAPLPAAPRKSASRARLAKMQEKGLFKNG